MSLSLSVFSISVTKVSALDKLDACRSNINTEALLTIQRFWVKRPATTSTGRALVRASMCCSFSAPGLHPDLQVWRWRSSVVRKSCVHFRTLGTSDGKGVGWGSATSWDVLDRDIFSRHAGSILSLAHRW